MGSNDIALLMATILGISVPITLALLVPHYHLDSVVLFSIPCGLVAGTATAVLAASDRRRAGKPSTEAWSSRTARSPFWARESSCSPWRQSRSTGRR